MANEYLLLSGGAREGVLDLNPEELGDYAKGADFDLDFTLLVPALKLHDRNQPVTLDMRHSPPCHSWLSLCLCDSNVMSRWSVCCQEENGFPIEEDEEEEGEMSEWNEHDDYCMERGSTVRTAKEGKLLSKKYKDGAREEWIPRGDEGAVAAEGGRKGSRLNFVRVS